MSAPAPDRPGDPIPPADALREADWAARPLDPRDYSRRTLLANERTYLAWWRTGLTALATGLAAARIAPELADASDRWPYTILGVLCAIAGVVAIAAGHVRRRQVEDALQRGAFPESPRALTAVLTGLGLLVGVGILLLVLLET